MTLRTKGEQKAYLDGYEMCAECIDKYLTDEGKQKLECLLMGVRNAVEIEDIEPCDDCIRREDALMALTGEYTESPIEILSKAVKRINALSFVTPAEKVGHWISNAEDDLKISEYTCSNCKGLSDEDSDFCPKCGSYNGGAK